MSDKTFRVGKGGGALALALVMLVSFSGFAGFAFAAPSDDVSFDGDTSAPNPYFDVDSLTVASHPMDMGASDADMAGYYDDSGDWVSNPEFEVNTTMNKDSGTNVNPYSFNPAHVNASFYGEFPRTNDDNNDASSLDASEWTEDESNTAAAAGNTAINDASIASGVDAVQVTTSAQTSGDDYKATYSNWTTELDTDESKRVIRLAGDIDTLDSGAVVSVNVTDESGDYKDVRIESGSNWDSTTDLAANSTGSFAYQIKLNQLSTHGGGSFDNIESIDVHVQHADADVKFSLLDIGLKQKVELGEERVDSDGDGTWDDSNTMYNASGDVSVKSMETLGSEYDDATVNDVTFPATFEASMLQGDEGDEEEYLISWDSADQYPSYDTILNSSYRMTLPTPIDLSYSGVDLQMEEQYPSGRYVTLGVAENVGDSTNITEASLSDQTGNLGSVGDIVMVDDTISTGDDYVIKIETKLTDGEQDSIQDTSGASAPPSSGDDGGIWGFFTSIPGMLISGGAGLLAFLGLRRRGG